MTKTIFSIGEIKEKSTPIATEYGVNKILLFGSYSKGTANSESDLDLYIEDKDKLHSLLGLSGMILDLQGCFGCEIDLLLGKIKDFDLFNNIL